MFLPSSDAFYIRSVRHTIVMRQTDAIKAVLVKEMLGAKWIHCMKRRRPQTELPKTHRTVRGMEKRKPTRDRVARQSYNPGMVLTGFLSLLDTEIARLKVAGALLAAGSKVAIAPRKAGGPPKAQPNSPKVPKRKKKRNLTPESRARIAEVVKRRWANRKKAAK
jgi:hypothetical protein